MLPLHFFYTQQPHSRSLSALRSWRPCVSALPPYFFSSSLHSGFFLGALCLVSNTFLFAFYSNLSKRWMQDISPMVLTGGTMISGAIGLVLLSLLDPAGNQWKKVMLLEVKQWIALLFFAAGCSVLVHF